MIKPAGAATEKEFAGRYDPSKDPTSSNQLP